MQGIKLKNGVEWMLNEKIDSVNEPVVMQRADVRRIKTRNGKTEVLLTILKSQHYKF